MSDGNGGQTRTGVLLVGACGYISVSVMAGVLALKKRLCPRDGMVTELECFSGLGLAPPEDMVFGGWEIRDMPPAKAARDFLRGTHIDPSVFGSIEDSLYQISTSIFPGVATNCGRAIEGLAGGYAKPSSAPLKEQVEGLRSDIRSFRDAYDLETVIVCNVASTEPPIEFGPCHANPMAFKEAIEDDIKTVVRASTLYSYAAILEGCPYINFTPSNGALPPALVELAQSSGVPVMGNDGKTGETLVKSALIPMFLYRNLEVLSWEGFNILGNMDGQVLNDPENRESKILTKDRVLGKVLGYSPHSRVHINYVPSLDDQKTAWNFVHFKGFLGAKMSLQFIWQGYDSLLAAPLVIDLARLAEFSKRTGQRGLMTHLSSFFKAPLGVEEHRLYEQFRMLFDYAAAASAAKVGS